MIHSYSHFTLTTHHALEQQSIVSIAPLFILLLIFLVLLYSFVKLTRTKNIKVKDDNDKERKLVPLPTLSIWKGLLWVVFVCRGNAVKLLQYIHPKFNIVDLKLLNMRLVLINDFEMGRELFKTFMFSAKPLNDAWTFFDKGDYGVLSTSGLKWKEQRKFCGQHLKELGLGTKSQESLIHEEIEDLIQIWRDKKGELFSPNKDFYVPIVSSIWMHLTGERAKDKELVNLVTCVFKNLINYMTLPEFLILTLKYKLKTLHKIVEWIPIFPGIKPFQKSALDLRTYFEKVVEERKKIVSKVENPNNFLDGFLKKIEETTDPESEFYGKQGEMHLVANMMDFFMAGGDTTANTLAWAMLHLIRDPKMQTKIQEEIDFTVGPDRHPSLQDRPRCPFTEAFLYEVLRCHPVAACSLPHVPEEDTNIGPYYIEKGTILLLNIYGINYDPNIWGDPDNFRPERFLSSKGKTVVKNEAMCSFSLGLRRCAGEQSAKDNLFLFVSAICQQFILKSDPLLKNPPSLEDNKSGQHTPKRFYMVAIDRRSLKL